MPKRKEIPAELVVSILRCWNESADIRQQFIEFRFYAAHCRALLDGRCPQACISAPMARELETKLSDAPHSHDQESMRTKW
jgi:hypothetical protein